MIKIVFSLSKRKSFGLVMLAAGVALVSLGMRDKFSLQAAGSPLTSAEQELFVQKVSPWLFAKIQSSQKRIQNTILNQDMKIPILVVLKERADLSSAKSLPSKQEKGRFVYEQLTSIASKSQSDLLTLLASKGLRTRSYFIVNWIAIYGADAALVRELVKRSDVERVIGNPTSLMRQPDPLVHLRKLPKAVPQAIGSNLVAIGVPRVWSELGVRGADIVVAGQDTGYDWQHPAIKSQYRGRGNPDLNKDPDHDLNWHDAIHEAPNSNPCGADRVEPCDDDEHGTHTMGTMLGDDGANNKIGMAPEAQWIGCRNMEKGQGSPATYTECFEWFLAPWAFGANPMTDGKPDQAPHIINNSWGCPYDEGCEGTEMKSVLEALDAAGIMVVVSAGNDGSSCKTINDQPSSHSDLVLSVGAFDHKTGNIASFSSRGPSGIDGGLNPHVAAPGVSIRSSIPGGEYTSMSGTSMAGPHVAGLVALVWSAQPKLIGKIKETKELIQSTALGKTSDQSCGLFPGSKIPNAVYGHGNIDAFAAVQKALAYEE
jgi:serine protease AprX